MAWADEPKQHPYSLVRHFADDDYIKPGKGGFMITLHVNDCDGFVAALKAKGVAILGQADEGYGMFACRLDPDGVKTRLWEQIADSLPWSSGQFPRAAASGG